MIGVSMLLLVLVPGSPPHVRNKISYHKWQKAGWCLGNEAKLLHCLHVYIACTLIYCLLLSYQALSVKVWSHIPNLAPSLTKWDGGLVIGYFVLRLWQLLLGSATWSWWFHWMWIRPCKVIFLFLVLEVTENGVQRAECIMEGEVCVQDHKLADTYADSFPGSFLEKRGLSPPPVFRGESSLEHGSMDGEATRCRLCKHCGCSWLLITSDYVSQVTQTCTCPRTGN